MGCEMCDEMGQISCDSTGCGVGHVHAPRCEKARTWSDEAMRWDEGVQQARAPWRERARTWSDGRGQMR
eukprot:671995-Rhodomonas_salina.2